MYLTTKILHLILSWYLPRYVTHCSYKRHHLPNTVLSQAPQEQLRPHLRNRRLRAAIKLTTRISLLNRIRYETRMTWTHAGLLLCNWQLDSVKRDNYFAYTDVDSKGWRNFQKKKKKSKLPQSLSHLGKSVGLGGLRVWHLITDSVTFSTGF